jgi:DNA-binding transcriptional MerR regulator
MSTMPVVSDIIQAFSEEHVERLTGLTKRQLRHWDRTGFFVPAFAVEDRRETLSRVYSFKDLVVLRVLSVLRNQYGVSLQHLRLVSDKLSHLDEDRWTCTTLYVLKERVAFVDPDTGTPREIVSGQYALGIALAAVISDTKRDIRQLRKRQPDKIGSIERNRQVAQNAWVIAGTRIPAAAIKRFHDAGYSKEQILKEYPDLTEKDVVAALAHKEEDAAA